MFDNMNKIHSAMLGFFSNIDVDKNKSMYRNYISFTDNPVDKNMFKNITSSEQERSGIFEKLFLYKVYGVFEIKNPLKIILMLKKLNIDELAYLTFEEYLIVTTMYKNDNYLHDLYNFYTLALTDDRLFSILTNIELIEQIPNFVHPYNYMFMMQQQSSGDTDSQIINISELIQISEIIDNRYGNKWTRAYTLIKCSVEIREVKNIITNIGSGYWLMKNDGIFFPTTDKNLFHEYNTKRKCKFGGHSFEYLLDDLRIPETFSLFEIVSGLKKIFNEKTKQKYIDVINYLRVVKNYKDTEFIFSNASSGDTLSLIINKNKVNVIENGNAPPLYLISPCSNIKSTYYMEF